VVRGVLCDEPGLAVSCVKKLLRYLAVRQPGGIGRAEEIEVAGQVNRPGDGVAMVLDIANPDPARYGGRRLANAPTIKTVGRSPEPRDRGPRKGTGPRQHSARSHRD